MPKQKEEEESLENSQGRGGRGGGEGSWVYEVGKTKKSAKQGKHHCKLYKSMPLQVTKMMKQWRKSVKTRESY